MRRLALTAVTAMFVIVTLGAAVAQAPAGQGRAERRAGRRPARAAVLRDLSVLAMPPAVLAKELDLNADQTSQIKTIVTKFRADAKALRPAPGTRPDAASRQKMRSLATTTADRVKAVLTPEQKQKLAKLLREITALRFAGIPPRAAPALKLTAVQKTRIAALVKDAVSKVRGLRGPERRQQLPAIRADLRSKVEGVMTPDQLKVLERFRARRPGRRVGGPGAAPGVPKN